MLSGCKCFTCKRWWWGGERLLAGRRHALCLCLARPSLARRHTGSRAGRSPRARRSRAERRGPGRAPSPGARRAPRAPASSPGCSPRAAACPALPRQGPLSPLADSLPSSASARRGTCSGDGHPRRPSLGFLGASLSRRHVAGNWPAGRVRQPGSGARGATASPRPRPPAASLRARGEHRPPPSLQPAPPSRPRPLLPPGRARDPGPRCSRDFSPANGPESGEPEAGVGEGTGLGEGEEDGGRGGAAPGRSGKRGKGGKIRRR